MKRITQRQETRIKHFFREKKERKIIDDDDAGFDDNRRGPGKFRHRSLTGDARCREPVIRMMAKNVEALLIVVSFVSPSLKTGLVDRFLVMAELENLEPLVVFNKKDLLTWEYEADSITDLYGNLGYKAVAVSAATGEGIETIREFIRGRACALAGHSGVGKSTILNQLLPPDSRTAGTRSVSLSTGKGVHTTTTVELYRTDDDTVIFDLPGLKSATLHGVTRMTLSKHFREFRGPSADCRYRDCTHTHEPGCGVKKALDADEISPDRYESYLRILETLRC